MQNLRHYISDEILENLERKREGRDGEGEEWRWDSSQSRDRDPMLQNGVHALVDEIFPARRARRREEQSGECSGVLI